MDDEYEYTPQDEAPDADDMYDETRAAEKYDPYDLGNADDNIYTENDYLADRSMSPLTKEEIKHVIAKMRTIHEHMQDNQYYVDENGKKYDREESERLLRKLEDDILKKKGLWWFERPSDNFLVSLLKNFIQTILRFFPRYKARFENDLQSGHEIDMIVQSARNASGVKTKDTAFERAVKRQREESRKQAETAKENESGEREGKGKQEEKDDGKVTAEQAAENFKAANEAVNGDKAVNKGHDNDEHEPSDGKEAEKLNGGQENSEKETEKEAETEANEPKLELTKEQKYRQALEEKRDALSKMQFEGKTYDELNENEQNTINADILVRGKKADVRRLQSFTPDEITKELVEDIIKYRDVSIYKDKEGNERPFEKDENGILTEKGAFQQMKELARLNPAVAEYYYPGMDKDGTMLKYLNLFESVPETLQYFAHLDDVKTAFSVFEVEKSDEEVENIAVSKEFVDKFIEDMVRNKGNSEKPVVSVKDGENILKYLVENIPSQNECTREQACAEKLMATVGSRVIDKILDDSKGDEFLKVVAERPYIAGYLTYTNADEDAKAKVIEKINDLPENERDSIMNVIETYEAEIAQKDDIIFEEIKEEDEEKSGDNEEKTTRSLDDIENDARDTLSEGVEGQDKTGEQGLEDDWENETITFSEIDENVL